ncbi:NAPDH-dependent diflavin reductase [Rhodotorula paludigena]|uniref:NAPDH-dependent diflavin reductase n=1 Tax=Rhodotorula paludigena TaxID=86838 RepID=UPI003179642B
MNGADAYSPLPLEGRTLLVLHASVTGTAIDIAERIGRRGRREGWAVTVKSVAQFDQAELLEHGLVVFVVPTTGNGHTPPQFVPLWTALLHPGLPPDLLEDLRYAVFALGDSSYGKYNWVGKKLSRRLDSLGAHAVVDRGEGDDQNEWGVESTFPGWLDTFFAAVDPLHPPAPGFVPLPPTALPPARIRLEKVASPSSSSARARADDAPLLWTDDARWARLVKNERVTAEDWYQDVREIELELEDVEENERTRLYQAGDVLELRPQNSSEEVDRFLETVRWTDIADDIYTVSASDPNQPLPPHLPTLFRTTLRYLLTYELDISSVPRQSFFEWLAAFSEGDKEEKLRWFCEPAGQDDLIDYTIRPRRTINEVLYEFREAEIPPEYILDLLPPIRPRGFSISSSPASHNGKVDLLVAIVKYKTILSVPRKGLATTYLSTLAPGARLPIRFDKSGTLKLPPSAAAPLIMVGPGTGVAPFRALLEERVRAGAKENLLFFGCRSSSKDFYFRSYWDQLVADGTLTLSVAPSRDQEDKVYVQHRIPLFADQIWDYLQRDGYLYVCGSSTQMPKAVKKAMLAVVRDKGGMSEEEAEKYWDALERCGRLVEETWG